MKGPIRLFFLSGTVIFLFLLIAPSSFGQKKTDKTPKEMVDKSAKKDTTKKKVVTIADKVKSSKKIEGLFELYQDTASGSLQMMITEDQIGQEFIYQSFSMGGPPALFLNQNMLRETWLFSIKKVFNKIHFEKVNTNFYFDETKAISKAANVDVSGAKFYSSKIVAKDSSGYLIAVDGLFLSDVLDKIKPNYPPSVPPAAVFKLGKVNKEKSNYLKLRSFPQNTDVVVSLSYDNPAPMNSGGKDITDARYVEVKMQHTFIQLPDNDYQPRYDDPRVGYFLQSQDDMTTTENPNYRDMINRWHLKKKNPSAVLSEPVEPIVWWVENTTPVEYREVILEAGAKWNEAFEKAGFKNAVVMKMMPDDAKWDPADIRYNVIRWVSSDLGFAIGPSFVNPKTGQILGADITMDFGMLLFTLGEEAISQVAFGPHNFEGKNEYAIMDHSKYCTLAHGKKIQQATAKSILELFAEDDEAELKKLSMQFMTELVLHEMGHTMGLNHNMKASQMLSPEELLDQNVTREFACAGSVMDYTCVNISSDRDKQGDYYSVKTGPYDWWAIEFGYTQFEDGKEAEGLKKILGRSTDPKLIFGNDADITGPGRGIDPRVQVWDQSNDMVAYGSDRLKLVNSAMDKLAGLFVKPDKSYQDLLSKYYLLSRDRYTMVSAVSRYIAGIYVDRSLPEQQSENAPFTPVSKEVQKSALNMLSTYILSPNAFDADKVIYPYLQNQRRGFNFGGKTEDPKIQNYVLGIQMNAINYILHPVTLSRSNNSSLYGNKYSVDQIVSDLMRASFDSDFTGQVNLFRQNLQTAIVSKLLGIATGKSKGYDYVSTSVVYQSVLDLYKKLKKSKSGDSQTKAHQAKMKYDIEQALDID